MRKHDLPQDAGVARGPAVDVDFEGKHLAAYAGEPLMAALIAHGVETASRSVKYHRPRGAFCLAGSCGQCWMRIEDLPNRAACTTPVTPGLSARRENAFPSADFDLFRAADKLFGDGLDHHRLGTTPIRPFNLLVQDTARRLAGLGSLSEQRAAAARRVAHRRARVAVVGAGPAGLTAARTAASLGLEVLLLEARPHTGGQLTTTLFDDVPSLSTLPGSAAEAVVAAGGELWTSARVLGVYVEPGQDHPKLLVRRDADSDADRLVVLEAETLILATGGYEQAPLFEANDLPGHYGARAFAELALRHRVLPGKRVVIGDAGTELGPRLFSRLGGLGVETFLVSGGEPAGLGAPPSRHHRPGWVISAARGGTHVKGVELVRSGAPAEGGEREHLTCDVIASASPVSPAFELGRQAGCAIAYRPEAGGFAVATDPATGATSAGWIFAAGDVTGAKSAGRAALEGELAGISAVLASRARRGERGDGAPGSGDERDPDTLLARRDALAKEASR